MIMKMFAQKETHYCETMIVIWEFHQLPVSNTHKKKSYISI